MKAGILTGLPIAKKLRQLRNFLEKNNPRPKGTTKAGYDEEEGSAGRFQSEMLGSSRQSVEAA